ncbi:MAG TPA: fibronectin type III-like domain-contianing protein, partial [bacterium]|nr:fibronectin type III-like domain-contianing protein [bacterium]
LPLARCCRRLRWKMTCTVKNTGKAAGKEAVQLYVSAPAKTLAKPAQELKAFAKTRLLQPGESQEVTFTLSPYDLASFDQVRSAWVTEAGSYRLLIAASSRDVRATATLQVAAEQIVRVHDVMRPAEKIATIR